VGGGTDVAVAFEADHISGRVVGFDGVDIVGGVDVGTWVPYAWELVINDHFVDVARPHLPDAGSAGAVGVDVEVEASGEKDDGGFTVAKGVYGAFYVGHGFSPNGCTVWLAGNNLFKGGTHLGIPHLKRLLRRVVLYRVGPG
jgi:hypothetical protein